MLHKCSKCGVEKLFSDYTKRSGRPIGRSSHCKECRKLQYPSPEQQRIYRAANVLRAREADKRYRATHLEEERRKDREYKAATRAVNPGPSRIAAAKWQKRHPAKANANAGYRQAYKIQATPAWANDFFIEEAYHLAKLREKVCGGKWEVDHIVPLRSKLVCGLHVEYNLQVIPKEHNRAKGNRYWPSMP